MLNNNHITGQYNLSLIYPKQQPGPTAFFHCSNGADSPASATCPSPDSNPESQPAFFNVIVIQLLGKIENAFVATKVMNFEKIPTIFWSEKKVDGNTFMMEISHACLLVHDNKKWKFGRVLRI